MARRNRATRRPRTDRRVPALVSAGTMTAVLPPAAAGLFVAVSGSALSDDIKDLLYSLIAPVCALLLFFLLRWTNSVRGRDDLISGAGLGTFVLAAFVIGLTVFAVNDHTLAFYGRTEQVTITSVSREPHEAGGEDNPVDYFTYNYEVTDMRGKRVNGEIRTNQEKQEFHVGQRIAATVDPRGRLDPILGRPGGTGIYFWLALAAEVAIIGLVIKNALPDWEERSEKAWEAAYRALRDSGR